MSRRAGDWRQRAACREADPELFFPVGRLRERGQLTLAGHQAADAKVICGRCPVTASCLAFALESRAEPGVWGGLDEDERRELLGLPGGDARKKTRRRRA